MAERLVFPAPNLREKAAVVVTNYLARSAWETDHLTPNQVADALTHAPMELWRELSQAAGSMPLNGIEVSAVLRRLRMMGDDPNGRHA